MCHDVSIIMNIDHVMHRILAPKYDAHHERSQNSSVTFC